MKETLLPKANKNPPIQLSLPWHNLFIGPDESTVTCKKCERKSIVWKCNLVNWLEGLQMKKGAYTSCVDSTFKMNSRSTVTVEVVPIAKKTYSNLYLTH